MTLRYLPSPALSRRHLLIGSTSTLSLWLLGCGGGRPSAADREADESWAGSLLDPPFTKPDVRFTDFHSAGPMCSPTRAAMLTGQYQQRFGARIHALNAPVGPDGQKPGQHVADDQLCVHAET